MKILLIWPEFPANTYWSFSEIMPMLGRKCLLPPLGLISIASMLPDDWNVRLADLNVNKLNPSDLDWADAVFISGMMVQDLSMREAIAKSRNAGKIVVAGGPHATSQFKELEGIDHLVAGEAEKIMDIFCRDLAAGKAKRVYARLAQPNQVRELLAHFGDDSDVRLDTERPSMDLTPVPRYDLLPKNAYVQMAIQTSRGCPIGCEFCDIWRRFGKKPRYRSADRVRAELDAIYASGHRAGVFVVDDNFIGNKRHTRMLVKEMTKWQKEHDYPFWFLTEATLTLADDSELCETMRQAGFNMVFVGIETPAKESLAETGKAINFSRSTVERVAKLQSYGLEVTSGFIVGFDNDPPDIAKKMTDFINELGIPVAMTGLLTALPETDLYDRLKREGRIKHTSQGSNTYCFKTNFRTSRPESQVVNDYKTILKNIYSQDMRAYFKRCRVLRSRIGKPANIGHTSFRDLLILGRYLLNLPVNLYSWNALKFMISTLFTKPWFFPGAISVSMQGYHFREITRKTIAVAEAEPFLDQLQTAFSKTWNQSVRAWLDHGENLVHGAMKRRRQILSSAEHHLARLSRSVRDEAENRFKSFVLEIESSCRNITFTELEKYFLTLRNTLAAEISNIKKRAGNSGDNAAVYLRRLRDQTLNEAASRLRILSKETRMQLAGQYERFRIELSRYVEEVISKLPSGGTKPAKN